MRSKIILLAALGVVLVIPFLLRKEKPLLSTAEDTVVVITPHTESIRQEFGMGFSDWYQEKTGRSVFVDYRVIGGTSEISKFLDSQYTNSFRNHWVEELSRNWNLEVQGAYNDGRIELGDRAEDDTLAEAARRAFLKSKVSSGIDVFFGGGTYDFSVQAEKGNLVDAGLLEKHPDWFQEEVLVGSLPSGIPRRLAGESFYDAEGRWYGAVLSSYGIIFNRNLLNRLGIEKEPEQWEDLADPRYFGQVGVADPTKSGSMTQAFEMIIQQQMHLQLKALKNENAEAELSDLEREAVVEGWMKGMQVIQKIAANARYFSDTSQKPNIDVAMGDCAAGMTIDFYGRFQQENILARSGDSRFGFNLPEGGTTISADPIGLLRGSKNEEVAKLFIEYVLSEEGQRLWNFDVGTPGGPKTFSLRRPPIRPSIYSEGLNQYRSDKDYIPYLSAKDFTYRSDWTGWLFNEIRTIIRIVFIDVRKELKDAWGAIIDARAEGRFEAADRAEAILADLSKISYQEASTTIDKALKAPKIEEVILSRNLSQHFRSQFLRAKRVAEGT